MVKVSIFYGTHNVVEKKEWSEKDKSMQENTQTNGRGTGLGKQGRIGSTVELLSNRSNTSQTIKWVLLVVPL